MIFRRAKLRLALSYAAVQLILFATFGIGIYAYVTTAFDFDVADGESSTQSPEASLAMRPIRASFEAQQRFVDDASHEFRTPLSALQAQLELGLSRQRTIPGYRTILGHSLHATTQLTEILDDLIVLSRRTHDADIAMRAVDISTIVADAIEQLSPDESVRVRESGDDDPVVIAAPSMLTRALVNLLTNALRYSPADSDVTITTSRRGGFAHVVVEDHGTGMTRSEQELAFDRFWRADSSRSSEGRGLGLSIVKETAGLHGGRIELSSELGVGTTGSLEVPLSR